MAAPQDMSHLLLPALVTSVVAVVVAGKRKPASPISRDKYVTFPLVHKTIISPNTASYRFGLPHPHATLGLPIGQHISLCATVGDKEVVRSYTPTSRASQQGHFDVLIKTYPTGVLSSHIASMKLGDTIKVKGPKGQFKYEVGCARSIGMIAGGTGITPMYQIIQAVLENPGDPTQLSLIFANNTEEDILLREQLDAWTADPRFRVTYVLATPSPTWKGPRGFVTKELMREHLPAYGEGVKLLLCGPPPMIKAMTANSEDLGYPKANIVSKMGDAVFKF